jgi:hypothetical protein
MDNLALTGGRLSLTALTALGFGAGGTRYCKVDPERT